MATAVVHQPEPPSRALTFESPKAAHQSLLRLGSVLAPILPKGVSIDQFAAQVFFYVKKNPDLTQCTTESLLDAFQKTAESGLLLGSTCHVLKFGNAATFCADYKGIAQQMIASGHVRAVDARVVRKGDEFDYEYGLEERLRHVVVGDEKRPITHAYVVLKLKGGERQFLVMTIGEVDAIRLKHSRSWKNGECPAWYAKKTVVRQIAKTIPDPRLLSRLAVLDAAEGLTPADESLLTSGAQVAIPAYAGDDDAPTSDQGEPEEPMPQEYRLRHGVPMVDPDPYAEQTAAGEPTATVAGPDAATHRAALRRQLEAVLTASRLPDKQQQTFRDAAETASVGELRDLIANARKKGAAKEG